ncbi:regulator of volume decrease after cellular swelling-domain-containing protein [Cristinia sonorae]|uniref:Regulator of volume decrease after cellular swelling-domain-containing protein n=1 Tax=Cristinia sonorae TaxID=1940300 RepID=A0A8K0UJ60_9AGAR|nr:regulator of volume decrease after cellular swelling-domain-containing protein [Cristinia sonorae]
MAPFTVITALPTHISPEQHKELVASTPASFSDIPPVLRHTEHNVSISLSPPSEEFPEADCANGTLYVIESALVFMSASGRGIQVEYPHITLHAVSRSESGPSIYCQLDESAGVESEIPQDAEEEEEYTPLRELSLVPQDAASLDPIFEALSYCASLHPDPAAEDDMDDDDDAFIDSSAFETFNGDEDQELSEVGRVRSNFTNDNRYAPY